MTLCLENHLELYDEHLNTKTLWKVRWLFRERERERERDDNVICREICRCHLTEKDKN